MPSTKILGTWLIASGCAVAAVGNYQKSQKNERVNGNAKREFHEELENFVASMEKELSQADASDVRGSSHIVKNKVQELGYAADNMIRNKPMFFDSIQGQETKEFIMICGCLLFGSSGFFDKILMNEIVNLGKISSKLNFDATVVSRFGFSLAVLSPSSANLIFSNFIMPLCQLPLDPAIDNCLTFDSLHCLSDGDKKVLNDLLLKMEINVADKEQFIFKHPIGGSVSNTLLDWIFAVAIHLDIHTVKGESMKTFLRPVHRAKSYLEVRLLERGELMSRENPLAGYLVFANFDISRGWTFKSPKVSLGQGNYSWDDVIPLESVHRENVVRSMHQKNNKNTNNTNNKKDDCTNNNKKADKYKLLMARLFVSKQANLLMSECNMKICGNTLSHCEVVAGNFDFRCSNSWRILKEQLVDHDRNHLKHERDALFESLCQRLLERVPKPDMMSERDFRIAEIDPFVKNQLRIWDFRIKSTPLNENLKTPRDVVCVTDISSPSTIFEGKLSVGVCVRVCVCACLLPFKEVTLIFN